MGAEPCGRLIVLRDAARRAGTPATAGRSVSVVVCRVPASSRCVALDFRGEPQAVAHASWVPADHRVTDRSNLGACPTSPLRGRWYASRVNPLRWLDRLGAQRTEKGQVLYVLYVIIAILVIIFLLRLLGIA